MSRPAVEVADIVRAQGDRFLAQHPWLSGAQRTARCARSSAAGPPPWASIGIAVRLRLSPRLV